MYSSEAIDTLKGRVGWAQTIQPFPVSVDADNFYAASGRYAHHFHKLATAENVYMHTTNARAEDKEAHLNATLLDLRSGAVRKVLAAVFDNNEAAQFRNDARGNRIALANPSYSAVIDAMPSRFDDAIGYQIAIDAIEFMLSANRSNPTERSVSLSFEELRMELDGVKDEQGRSIAKGLYRMLHDSLANIGKLIFPVTNTRPTVRDISHLW